MPAENHLVALAKTMQASSAEPVLRSLTNHFIGSVCYMGRRGSNYTMDDLRAEVAAFHDAEAIVARRFAEASYPPMIVRDTLTKEVNEPCPPNVATAGDTTPTECLAAESSGAAPNATTEPAPTPQKRSIGRSIGGFPKAELGFSVWVENGEWFTAATVDPKTHGTHAYDDGGYEKGIRDCTCGCYMLSSSSGGPVDPSGACPDNPRGIPQHDPSNLAPAILAAATGGAK